MPAWSERKVEGLGGAPGGRRVGRPANGGIGFWRGARPRLRRKGAGGCAPYCWVVLLVSDFDELKRRVKKVFTLCPKDTEPSRTLSHAFFAWGFAASPASLILSPATSAPPTTVLPTPFAVSATPCPICLPPLSTCWVPSLTLESSAAEVGGAPSSPSIHSMTVAVAMVFIAWILPGIVALPVSKDRNAHASGASRPEAREIAQIRSIAGAKDELAGRVSWVRT